ncbi:MAG: tyrosine-type recombinase/integrase [Myxococcales bacterium]|nr:tyrosine-type recombinase/integrase [Myxococcales bacterium]
MKSPARTAEARSLTLDEAVQLVDGCPRQTAVERRNRLSVLPLYGCGLRTAELCGLNVEDIYIDRQELFVRKSSPAWPKSRSAFHLTDCATPLQRTS